MHWVQNLTATRKLSREQKSNNSTWFKNCESCQITGWSNEVVDKNIIVDNGKINFVG